MKTNEIIVSAAKFENIKINSLLIENKYVDEEGNANLPINKFLRVVDGDVYVKVERFTDETAEEVEQVFAKITEYKTLL
jgi:hypothetical protein